MRLLGVNGLQNALEGGVCCSVLCALGLLSMQMIFYSGEGCVLHHPCFVRINCEEHHSLRLGRAKY